MKIVYKPKGFFYPSGTLRLLSSHAEGNRRRSRASHVDQPERIRGQAHFMCRAELAEVGPHAQHCLKAEGFEVVERMGQGLQDQGRKLGDFLCICPSCCARLCWKTHIIWTLLERP